MPTPPARKVLAGAAGAIEAALALPDGAPRGVAVVAHPHPLYGGTMDNKVVTTVARTFTDAGIAACRFNFRGVGKTEGVHDEGRGEADDFATVAAFAQREVPGVPLYLAGFSFGGAIATRASAGLEFTQMVLVAPGFRRVSATGMGEAPDPNDEALGAPGRHTWENCLVVHGDRDDTVPLSDSLAWAGVREVPVAVVAGADHFFHRKLHVLREIVARWVR